MSSYLPPYGHFHIAPGGKQDAALRKYLDWNILRDYERFVNKVNERTLFQRGLIPNYDSSGDDALGLEVEYFHPSITADDRMVYIMENIVTDQNLDWRNIIGNSIISHFYGARGVHSVITNERDPKKAHVDFVLLADEQQLFKRTGKIGQYTQHLRDIAEEAKKNKLRIWGTTELHTSLQSASRRFVNSVYRGNPKDPDPGTWLNICEWISSWVYEPSSFNKSKTVMEGLAGSKNLKEAFDYLTRESGIGEYYGYHCATSNSVNPKLKFNHDDTFVAPGPGARQTLDLMFPNLSLKEVSYGDRVVWIRENQHNILNITFDKSLWNYTSSNGITIFQDQQNELKSYGTEVSLCQYSVYCRLKSNPHLISKRKVVRVENLCEMVVSPAAAENIENAKEEFQLDFLESEVKMSKKSNKEIDIDQAFSALSEFPQSLMRESVYREVEAPAQTQKTSNVSYESLVPEKEKYVLNALDELGGLSDHNTIAKLLETKFPGLYKQDKTWKETWSILQKFVKNGAVTKINSKYQRVK